MRDQKAIEQSYEQARQLYASLGVDTARALQTLQTIAISLHCWQGDDVGGFENSAGLTDGGIQVTGSYPGKARTPDQLRSDLECALKQIPGTHRLNLHASYAETGGKKVERDALCPEHFAGWISWAKEQRLGLDFNPTFFSHPLAADGFTLASRNEAARRFWVRHGIACRHIGAEIGRALGTPCINNFWIPDGYKDMPADRKTPRALLKQSLDEIFAEPIDMRLNRML